jgi:integrase
LAVEVIGQQLADVRQSSGRRLARLARRIAHAAGWTDAPRCPTSEIPEWVFPGPGSRKPMTVHAVAKAIKRARGAFGVEPFTSHDLRRTAATRMEELGVSPFVVAHVLGHVSVTKASVTSRVYARYDYAREKRAAVEVWEAHLRALVAAADTAVVLPLFERERA